MKKLILSTFLFAFTGLMAVQNVSMADEGDVYIGAKTGILLIDVSDVDDIIPIGVLLGYNIISDLSIEGEFNYTIAGGDIDFGIGSGDTDMWTLA